MSKTPQRTPIEKRIAFIEIAGADAGSFLNNLLSSSILELTDSNYISSAWHSQSGKVKCIVKIIKNSNCYVLAINKSIKQLITTQLLKYSLNLKVDILSDNDYVPQMLNLDTLQMIADGKGCYPGQEIINRINILGNTKRRIKYYIGKSNLKVKSMSEIVDLDNRKIGNLIRYVKIKNVYHILAVVEVNRKHEEVFISNSKNYPIHEQEIKNIL